MKTELQTTMSSFSLGNGKSSAPEEKGKSILSVEELAMRVADLEARPRMPGLNDALPNDVVALNGVHQPIWKAGLLPDGLLEGDLLVWHIDEGVGSWIRYVPTKSIMLWYDLTLAIWKELEVPSEVGKVVKNTATGGVEFNYPTYSA